MTGKPEQAARDFRAVVWPVLHAMTPGGRLEQVEISHDSIGVDLDVTGGIDAYVIVPNAPMQTWAVRVQWRYFRGRPSAWARGKSPMTFTIRARTHNGNEWTEKAKRIAAMTDGGVSPRWTLQAYLDDVGGPLENVAWVPTPDLYRRVQEREDLCCPFETKTAADGSQFLVVPWTEVPGYRWFRANRSQVQAAFYPKESLMRPASRERWDPP